MILPPNSIIVSGPIIIEDGKVLLNREHQNGKITDWFIPGGHVDPADKNLDDACRREAKEEMGIDIEIIKPLRTLLIKHDERLVIAVHYLAKRIGEIKPGSDIADWGWHDINNLPDNCAPNVYDIIRTL